MALGPFPARAAHRRAQPQAFAPPSRATTAVATSSTRGAAAIIAAIPDGAEGCCGAMGMRGHALRSEAGAAAFEACTLACALSQSPLFLPGHPHDPLLDQQAPCTTPQIASMASMRHRRGGRGGETCVHCAAAPWPPEGQGRTTWEGSAPVCPRPCQPLTASPRCTTQQAAVHDLQGGSGSFRPPCSSARGTGFKPEADALEPKDLVHPLNPKPCRISWS